jgi:molecular chaperone HscB
MINYFLILKLPITFNIAPNQLDNAYWKMQKLYHPDKHQVKKNKYIEKSTLINRAYEALRCPLKKAGHLLTLSNIDIKALTLPQEMLAEFMERHETISDIENKNKIRAEVIKIEQDKQRCISEISNYFMQNDLTHASLATAKLKHIYRLEQTLEQKLCNL